MTTSSNSLPVDWNPHEYQKTAVRFLVERACAGLFLDPGLGKTSITYAALKILRTQHFIKRTLVIAPLRPCYLVWPAEAQKWSDFNSTRVEVLHGPDKNKALKRDADVYVINPEGLPWLFQQQNKWFYDKLDGLVIDESSKFKHTNTQRFKNLKPMLPKFKRRIILTGTPVPNGLLDLFGQIYILDGGAALGRFISHYRTEYFAPTGFGGYTWVLNKGAEEKILEKISPLVLRMSEVDYLKLPPLIKDTVFVDLPEETRELYDRLERDFVLQLRSGDVTAINAAAATMKLRQIANGGVYTDNLDEDKPRVSGPRTWDDLHDMKTGAVLELLEELGGKPTLIAYEFKHDLARLQKALKKVYKRDIPYIGGGVNMRDTKTIEAAWNAGQIPMLLVQPQSVSHGLNLQKGGRAVIFHSLTYNYEDYDQLIRRIWRQGQKARVFIYHIVARDTVDEAIVRAVDGKAKTQRRVFDVLREYTLSRKF